MLNADILNHCPAKHQKQRLWCWSTDTAAPHTTRWRSSPIRATTLHCSQVQSLLNYQQPLAAGCRSHGQAKNCRLQYRAALSQLRRKLQQLLPAPHTPNHLPPNFSISQGIHSQLNDGKKQLKWMDSNLTDSIIRCALNQLQWWDSISHTAAAVPNVPSEKPASRVG